MRPTLLLALSTCLLASCASYATPRRGADFHALGLGPEAVAAATDERVADDLARRPLAGFPAVIAVARLQGAEPHRWGTSDPSFALEFTRDVEGEDDLRALAGLPFVRDVAPLNRLVLPAEIESLEQLREGAAAAQADLLLLYTLDTEYDSESRAEILEVLTLGLFPATEVEARTTASLALLDVRSGFLYGLGEATRSKECTTNAWGSESAWRRARHESEAEAFALLLADFEQLWGRVVETWVPPQG